jgi:hypothetical protein
MRNAAVTAPTAVTAGVPDVLKRGQILRPGQYRRSANKAYIFVMQKDGNAVLYKGRTALWGTMTTTKGASIALQSDGNLVVFLGRKAIWTSRTYGHKPAGLWVQDDGNLVIYNTAKKPYWSRWTVIETLGANQLLKPGQLLYSRNSRFRLQMQYDGNLVLVQNGRTVLWSSGTGRHKGAFAVMQAAGNFVVYQGRTPLWATPTSKRGAILQMQNDGNLVIYSGRTALWSTGTGGH